MKSEVWIVHRSSETSERRSTAEAWMKHREKELSSPGGLEAAQRKVGTVGDVIKEYVQEKEGGIGRTKRKSCARSAIVTWSRIGPRRRA